MIRPTSFDSFRGQTESVELLKVSVSSARIRQAPLGHTLLVGPAGLGKTTLAIGVLPTEMGVEVRSLNCSAIQTCGDFTSVVCLMQASDILFLDEIHMLPVFAREHLLTVMEDFKLSISMEDKDKGVLELSVPPFTVIGATTRQGVLDGPLRSRFKNIVRLRSYTIDEMHEVCTWIGDRNDVSFTDESLARLSKVASGMARRAVNIIDACIDTICVKTGKPIIKGESVIAPEILDETLKRLGYVGDLDANEYRYMLYLYNNKTCSLRTLASALEEQPSTIEEVYEAGLIRDGLVHVSTTGRQLTEKGIKLFHDEKIGI